jgi:penicillin amidase
MTPARARGLLAMHGVSSFAEFRKAFRHWPGPPLNVAYADADGTIGWQLAGTAPRRRVGGGTIPLPAADPRVGWEPEPVPFEEMPHAENPATGWIATANNQPLREGEGPYLGTDWLDGYRVARIGEALAARDDWDLVGALDLQLDVQSVPWREVRDVVLDATAGVAGGAECHSLLTAWTGEMEADSPAAAVFELFLADMTRRIITAKAPGSVEWALGRAAPPLLPHSLFALGRVAQVVALLREQPPGWFGSGGPGAGPGPHSDEPSGEEPSSWTNEMRASLAATQASLTDRFGPAANDWAWGRVRPLTLQHPIGARKPLDRVFNLGPIPVGGDANTIAQASPDPADPLSGTTVAIASLRMAIDVGGWEHSRFSLPGGQSGNPLSPHYADQLPLWQAGDGVPIAWDEREVALATRHTLELRPVSSR